MTYKNICRCLAGLVVSVFAGLVCAGFTAAAEEPGSGPGSWEPEEETYVEFIDNILEEDTGFEMSFSYGFRNIAKSGRKLPFGVEMYNNTGEDMEAVLTIELPGSVDTGKNEYGDALIRYTYEVELPAGRETYVRDTVSVAGSSPVTLSLRSYDGELLCEGVASIDLQSGEGSELLIGVLSGEPDRLEYLDRISLGGTSVRTRTVELDTAGMPDTAAGLEQLDMLLISGFDTGELTEDNIQAIKTWTSAGGVLLTGTGGSTAADELFLDVPDITIGNAVRREVNMGLKYSKTGPDDAMMELDVCSVYAAGGIQVMQTDDIAMLTTIQYNNGIIGITAYDLCDISEFCENETEYAEDLIKDLLGSSRLEQLNSMSGGSGEILRRAGALVGVTDPEGLPTASGYVLFAAAYAAAVSFVSYLVLKSHGMQSFYIICCPIIAFMASVVIWLMGAGTRSEGITLDYAIIRELGEGTLNDEGFIKLSSPYAMDYSVLLDGDAKLYPVVSDGMRPMGRRSLLLFPGSDNGSRSEPEAVIGIGSTQSGLKLDVSGAGPFEGIISEYSLTGYDIYPADMDVDIELSYFDGEAGGRVVNNTGYGLRDAALLMYGSIIKLGDIGAGETVDIEGRDVIYCPVGAPSEIAACISGIDTVPGSGQGSFSPLKYSRLLDHYMEESMYGYFSGARFTAYTEGSGLVECSSGGSRINSSGSTLIVKSTAVSYEKDGYIWSNGMEIEPDLISGDYDAATNTTNGSCVLEYKLGTDIDVVSIDFNKVSEVFEDGNTGVFDGTVSVYNYDDGGYVQISRDSEGLDEDAAASCLSPGNTITVRYSGRGSDTLSGLSYLPVLSVTGRKR